MRGYRIPLWHEDRVLFIIQIWTAILSSWLWWVPIRCLIEGAPFEWANEFGMGRLSGNGMGGDFFALLLLSGMFLSIVYMGWRGANPPFKFLLLLWTSVNLATTLVIVLDDPSKYRFRGDTMGIDINLAWFMPVLKAGLVALVCYWIVREAVAPRVRSIPHWTPLNWKFMVPVLVCVPVSAVMLRSGVMHGVTDKIGWVLTYSEWFLVNLALLPWAAPIAQTAPDQSRAPGVILGRADSTFPYR